MLLLFHGSSTSWMKEQWCVKSKPSCLTAILTNCEQLSTFVGVTHLGTTSINSAFAMTSAIIRQYFLPTLGASFMKSVVTGLNSVALGVPLGAVLWMYCWGMRANIEILKICYKLNEYTKMAKMLFIKSNVNIELLGSGANRVVGLITTFGPHLSWITFIYRKYVSMLPSIT